MICKHAESIISGIWWDIGWGGSWGVLSGTFAELLLGKLWSWGGAPHGAIVVQGRMAAMGNQVCLFLDGYWVFASFLAIISYEFLTF